MALTITVDGMSCDHCEATVEDALKGVSGVLEATADHQAGEAVVDGDPDVSALVAAVQDAGYDATA